MPDADSPIPVTDTAATSDLVRMLTDRLAETSARRPFIAGENTLTYGDLHDRIARTRGLFDRLDAVPGDRVVIASADDASVTALYVACLLNGLGAVVIDPQASAAEATVLIDRARARLVFADQSLIERAALLQSEDGATVIPVSDAPKKAAFGLVIRKRAAATDDPSYPALLADEIPVAEVRPVAPDATALILFTSGTTSKPKGVELTHANMAAQMEVFRSHFALGPDSRIANHLPLHHSDGLNQGPLLALAMGGAWIRPTSPNMQTLPDCLDLIYRERATHLVTVPTVLAMMLRLPESYDDSFREEGFAFIESTAGYLDENVWQAVEERFGVQIVNCYGLTETVNEALYCGPTAETRRRGTIGKPVGCEARIVGDDGADMAEGKAGELLLRGDVIMRGYFDDPEATAAVIQDGWLHSGDLAVRDADGFYRIVGRKKNVVVRGGINVYPEDVTSALLGADAVDAAATIGLPDEIMGERVVACVVLAGDSSAGTDALFAHCRKALAPERQPNDILVMDDLPYGPSGKVELANLKTRAERMLEGRAAADTDSAGTTAEKVLGIAAKTFGTSVADLSAASTPDNTEGWDSLSFLELVMSLERQFDFKMAPREVMNIDSLDAAIRIVEAQTGG